MWSTLQNRLLQLIFRKKYFCNFSFFCKYSFGKFDLFEILSLAISSLEILTFGIANNMVNRAMLIMIEDLFVEVLWLTSCET